MKWPRVFAACATSLLGFAAWGAGEADSGDGAWVLTSTVLVLMMTIPGLSLFYAGLVRASNVLSVLMQCFAITCIVSLLWVAVGYSLAFGEGNFFIGDLSHAFFMNIGADTERGSIPEMSFAVFQMAFAIITPALIVGGFAERMRFSAALLFAALWSLVVYAPIAHWVRGGGWLMTYFGMMDFGGGTVVHVTAGVAALVAALTVGARRGFPESISPPHNMTLTMAGAGLLWVGWFGFNGGSALTSGGDAAMAVAATHISAAMGAFTWMAIEWLRYGRPTALGAVTGMVAGLGTITPAAGFVTPLAAIAIGLAAGVVCFLVTQFMNLKLKVDDSLDVFAVHAVGGGIGTVLTGVFASAAIGLGREDILIGPQVQVQLLGVLAVASYTAIGTFLILRLTDRAVGNRVAPEAEVDGIDVISHNERGYDL